MAADKTTVEFVETTQQQTSDGILAQEHAVKDAEDDVVRDLKDVDVTLATITATHRPELFSKGMIRLWVIVCNSPLVYLLQKNLRN